MATLTRRRAVTGLPVPTEHIEQAAVVAWAEDMSAKWPELAMLFAVPNFAGHMGRAATRLRAGAKAKREGRKAGVPDLVLPVARHGYHGLFIEMKRQRGGTVSPEQREWHTALREQGYAVYVCKGAFAAITVLTAYLEPDNGK
jgi:hypothetical protein